MREVEDKIVILFYAKLAVEYSTSSNDRYSVIEKISIPDNSAFIPLLCFEYTSSG